jgi:hypothetical protein
VEKVGYINVFIFTLILKSMTVAKLERDFSLLVFHTNPVSFDMFHPSVTNFLVGVYLSQRAS